MKIDLVYDGQRLHWNGHGVYRASSGLPGYQNPRHQCVSDRGPVPEGVYSFGLIEDPKLARQAGGGECRLLPAQTIQRIPRGAYADVCEPYFANWGVSRVQLTEVRTDRKPRCHPSRNGFYLHDSVKGYSHGCIEVATAFFDELRSFIAGMKAQRVAKRERLYLKVQYVPDRDTNGGTKKPS